MDESLIPEIIDELISSLEPLETQSEAVLQFLKDKGIADDETLAPYLEQAGNASNVRWRAFRLRALSLISSAMKPAEKEQKTELPQGDKEETKEATTEKQHKEEQKGGSAPEVSAEDHHEAHEADKPAAKTQTPEEKTKDQRKPEKKQEPERKQEKPENKKEGKSAA